MYGAINAESFSLAVDEGSYSGEVLTGLYAGRGANDVGYKIYGQPAVDVRARSMCTPSVINAPSISQCAANQYCSLAFFQSSTYHPCTPHPSGSTAAAAAAVDAVKLFAGTYGKQQHVTCVFFVHLSYMIMCCLFVVKNCINSLF